MNIIKYKMTSRGLCSELNSLLGLYQEQRQLQNLIYVDSTDSIYFKSVSIQDIFEFNDVPFISSLPISNIFQIISANQYRKYALKRSSFQIDSEEINKVLRYTEDTKKIIQNTIDKLNLPKEYACIHIRRGDKVGEALYRYTQKRGKTESKRYEFDCYLKELESLIVKNEQVTIFIMTDDYRSINEAKLFLQKNNLDYNLIYLTLESQLGHSTDTQIDNNYSYTKTELFNFFAEIEIAKHAKYFIGTESSNIYRFIKNISSKNINFISLD